MAPRKQHGKLITILNEANSNFLSGTILLAVMPLKLALELAHTISAKVFGTSM